jgi:hypothetical protein
MYCLKDKKTNEILAMSSSQDDCWQIRDGVAEWVEVVPQPLTKAQLIAAVDAKYNAIYTDYEAKGSKAAWLGQTAAADYYRQRYNAAVLLHKSEKDVINNG